MVDPEKKYFTLKILDFKWNWQLQKYFKNLITGYKTDREFVKLNQILKFVL